MTLFFGVFLAAGLAIFSATLPSTLRHAATYAWHTVPCRMVESAIVVQDSPEGGAAGWHVAFAYAVEGREYVGRRLTVNHPVGSAHDDLRRSQQLSPGTATTCLVNPANPADAVLERQGFGVLLVPLFPLIFVAVGGGGIWAAWRRSRAPQGLTARVATRSTAERRGRLVGMLFGGVFFVVGVVLTWLLFIRPVLGIAAAKSWPEVPCEIVSSEVASHSSDDGTTYSIEITYRYEVDGRAYVSNRYGFTIGSSSGYKGKAQVVAAHPPGSRATCFVNPADPTDAVMDRGWTAAMGFGLIPVVFALVGGGLLLAMLRKPGAAADAGAFRGGTPGAAGAAGSRSSGAGAVPVGIGTGPLELKPVSSRRIKVLGAALVALFWNGIVSVFVVQLFSGGWAGFSWFLAIFLTPFVAVGVFLVVLLVRQVLALSNPVPVLTLATPVLHPGGRLEVSWVLRGRVQALRHLRLTLEGREEATYRRGTDTRTDREVFAEFPVAEASDPAGLAAGRAALELPRRLMHSFSAAHNKITWQLRVRGDVPRWPDIDDEYTIVILPPGGATHE